MGDIKYQVVVEYGTKGTLKAELPALTAGTGAVADALARAKGEASGLEKGMGSVGEAFRRAGGAVVDGFIGVVERAGAAVRTMGTIAAAGALAAVTYGVSGLNSELEKTKIGLADILTSNGVTDNLTAGLDASAGLMKQIRKDAAALPGETKDLAQIFKLASIPGLRSGASVGRIEKLSANAMAYGMGTVGLDSGTTSRELSMLLSGRAGSHNTLGLQLAGLGGGEATKFNKLSDSKRFEFLEKEFAKHQGSIALYANSFEGLYSSLKDNAKLVLSDTTSPLFESVKQTLREANDWFTNSPPNVAKLGEGLAEAWRMGIGEIKKWYPEVRSFAGQAYQEIAGIWHRIEPVVARVSESIRTSLGDGSAIKRIEEVLKLYGEVKLARGLGSAASPFASMASSMFGMVGGGGASGAAAGAAGGAAASGAAIAGGVVAAIAAAGVGGEMIALANGNRDAADAAGRLSTSMGRLTDDVVGGQTGLSKFLQMVGTEGTSELAKFFDGLHGIANFGDTVHKIEQGQEDAQASYDEKYVLNDPKMQGTPAYKAALDRKHRRQFKASWNSDVFDPNRDDSALDFTHTGGAASLADKLSDLKGKGTDGKAGTTINNYFTISSNHDPSRIARDVVDKIADMRRHPTQSRHVTNPSGTT